MNHEFVDGVQVVRTEEGAEMAWLGRKADGNYARTRLANTLHLVNMETVYACAVAEDCDYTAATVQAITAGHAPKVHGTGNGPDARKRSLQAHRDVMDMTVKELLAFIQRADLAQAEDWRVRALDAERRLAAIERHFN